MAKPRYEQAVWNKDIRYIAALVTASDGMTSSKIILIIQNTLPKLGIIDDDNNTILSTNLTPILTL
ncbi:MAG: hypothetical protein J7J01_07630 [Methanophagales archaeon]|nr:hypothetical protein [Methanophagales archaeon]